MPLGSFDDDDHGDLEDLGQLVCADGPSEVDGEAGRVGLRQGHRAEEPLDQLGRDGPLLVAVDQKDDPGAAKRLAEEFRSTEGVATVVDPITNEAGDTAQIPVYPVTSPQSSETSDLVTTFRDDVIPATLADSNAKAHVGGTTATNDDVASKISERFPLFLLYVVGITFLLLTMAFRSIVVAAKAAVTTLLSAAAGFARRPSCVTPRPPGDPKRKSGL